MKTPREILLERHLDAQSKLDVIRHGVVGARSSNIIGGGPLHYEHRGNGKFILYSIGWNEKDDGGVDSSEIKNTSQYAEGDWVWK